MLINDFNNTIDAWIKNLEPYSFANLCMKPTPGSWSLGQLYLHLINDTRYYIEQIEPCLSSNNNATEQIKPNRKALLLANEFPDIQIEGHPDNAFIPQPESKEQLLQSLQNIKDDMNSIWLLIQQTPFNGKSKHDGFGYMTAAEWFQLAEMHFRHHLRQKKRLDDFLAASHTKKQSN